MAEPRSGTAIDWNTEEDYWRTNYASRPYAGSDRDFNYWRPGYQYGYESAMRHQGRSWNEVENDLETGWDKFQARGQTTWEQIKDAVRDGWDRVTGKR